MEMEITSPVVEPTAECPRCERQEKLTVLAECRGVCFHCWRGMTSGARATHKRKVDQAIEEEAHAHEPTHDTHSDNNGFHWIMDGRAASFDWAAVAKNLGEVVEASPEALPQAGEALARLFDIAFNGCSVKAGLRRLTVFCFMFAPHLFKEASLTALSKSMGITKQAVNKQSNILTSHLRVQLPWQRTAESRRKMSEKKMGHGKYAPKVLKPDSEPVPDYIAVLRERNGQ